MESKRIPLYGAVTLTCIGLLLVFSTLLHLLNGALPGVRLHFYHYAIRTVSIISLPIIGTVLIYLSAFIYHRRLLAAYLSSGLSFLMLLYLLIVYSQGIVVDLLTLLIVIYILFVIRYRKEFTVKNNLEGFFQYFQQTSIIALVGILYGVTIFYLFGPRLFHTHFSMSDSLNLTLDGLTGFSGTIALPTHLGRLFINSLGGVGIVIFTLLLGAFFRPLHLKVWGNSHEDRTKAEKIIAKYSRSSEDFFKLWPNDKQYYFSFDSTAFLAYKQSGHTIILLGGPVGRPALFDTLVHDFVEYCYSLGWRIAVLNVNKEAEKLYKRHGLNSIFIGNEGVISIPRFIQETLRNKHFRYVRNKARRDQLEVVEWNKPTQEQLRQLGAISNAWLKHGGRREYVLFMGYFDYGYLERCRVFVLYEKGQPKGYMNLIPTYFDGHSSLDQFRSYPNTSSVGMHFLLMSVIVSLSKESKKTLNIGLSPLSGIYKETGALPRVILRLIRLLGTPYYSFRGLEQFKNKFEPHWDRQFLLYSGASTNLLPIVKDIEYASSYSGRRNLQVYLSTISGIIVFTLGLYFIFN